MIQKNIIAIDYRFHVVGTGIAAHKIDIRCAMCYFIYI